MTVTQLVKNDTAPRLNLTLKQGSSPIDLTDATVLFKFGPVQTGSARLLHE